MNILETTTWTKVHNIFYTTKEPILITQRWRSTQRRHCMAYRTTIVNYTNSIHIKNPRSIAPRIFHKYVVLIIQQILLLLQLRELQHTSFKEGCRGSCCALDNSFS